MGCLFSKLECAAEALNLPVQISRKEALVFMSMLAASYVTYLFAVKPFLSPLRKIPGLPYNPLFGNVREAMTGEAMATSTSWVRQFGGMVRFYHLLGREMLLVADPEALKHILVTNESNYRKPVSGLRRDIAQSVLVVDGTEHKMQRRLLNPHFGHQAVKEYLSTFENCVRHLVDYWEVKLDKITDGKIPVQEDLHRMTLDVFGKAVLGYQFDSLNNPTSEVASAFHSLTAEDAVSFKTAVPILKHLATKKKKVPTATLR